MALNLKKKTLVIISVVVGVLSISVTGYIIWRTSKEEPFIPTEAGAVYDCLKNGVPVPCSSIGMLRCHCPDGTWIIGTGSCGSVCKGHLVASRTSSGGSCNQGSQCSACEWPNVAYCGCPGDSNPSPNKCGCRRYNSTFSCGSQCGSANKCTPGACPSGWVDCGLSGSSSAKEEGCVAKTKCTGSCSGCSNEFVIKRYCREAPSCGDGELEPGEECELGDPEGATCSWDNCDQSTCNCPEVTEPMCGDGILGNTEGEECELGDPDGVTCSWDNCDQSTCNCPEVTEPSCGDGILGNTEGEECELGDPDGVTCSWDNCDQSTCNCPEVTEPMCGDGILGNTEGEECELGDPEGITCDWDTCNQSTCTCEESELPETGILSASSVVLASSVTMIIYGLVIGLLEYMRGSNGRRDKGFLRRLGL